MEHTNNASNKQLVDSEARANAKRSRSPSESLEDGGQPSKTTLHRLHGLENNTEIYGASHFGEWGEFIQRKRAKLQIQNSSLEGTSDAKSDIFRGLAIYINGWTRPSVQELRKLIVAHGGVFQPYLDKKSLVTHIITCSLTPAKIREFKHMKVVRPEWLVESANAGTLLPWTDYIFHPGGRAETYQGSPVGQTTLKPVPKSTPPPSPQVQVNRSEPRTPVSPPRSPLRPLYTTDPCTYEDAARVPGYAIGQSNEMAERVMADPQWRAAHTSIAPDFIEGFYKKSRLHHLSMWKAELRNLVMEAQERAEREEFGNTQDKDGLVVQEKAGAQSSSTTDVSMGGVEFTLRSPTKNKGKNKAETDERVFMHCDFDCFFVSAGLTTRPHLRGKPVVVCHSQGNQGGASSTSEIASSSYEARSFGIKNGMSLRQAKQLCPSVVTIPYEFERYRDLSSQFYTILMRYADDLEAVSVDEALVDVSHSVATRRAAAPFSVDDHALSLAETIREEVKATTGCDVSIGIAENIQLARIATRKAKPAGLFHLKRDDVQKVLEPLDIDDLHGFGYSTREKAKEKLGTANVGELAKKSKGQLCAALGKGTGETLYKAIRGIDDRKLESDKPRRSVSCDINYGVRFENNEQTETFIYQMAEEVARRMSNISVRGRSLTLKIMKRDPSAPKEAPKARFLGHGICETFNKQTPLSNIHGQATSDSKDIGEHAWKLLKSFNFDPRELRGVGIQIQKLEKTGTAENSAQARLPFQPALRPKTPDKAEPVQVTGGPPQIVVQPPSQEEILQQNGVSPGGEEASAHDIPSFSQVDKEVFDALPEDIRKELENEYKRRSKSPVLNVPPPVPAERHPRIVVKGAGTNVKRITKQLAPRTKTTISPRKSTLFARRVTRVGPSSVRVSEAELQELGIDPEVFAALPVDVQREQLITARHLKNGGVLAEPKVLKYAKRKTRVYPKKPPPLASHPQHPFLKQQGPKKGEKLYFTKTDDVQRVIEAWVENFKEDPPNQKDVEYFSKFLVQSAESSDTGMEKTVAVMRWWLVLLRRHWGFYEHHDLVETEPVTQRMTWEKIGRAWWAAFREVKSSVDAIATKRFGGTLCLK
ncbi:hypothetical protein EDD15DRAFT_2173399 [Pisolithus albus]|nr:hypothetical protein EDD15DRAFT_2173399 [Pisolithus albus]